MARKYNYTTQPHAGQSHARARLTDGEVEMIRQLHESGELGYRRIARKFEISKRHVRDLVHYRRRVA